jgi:hypothetical protein
MVIEDESRINAKLAHHLKTDAIYQAELSPARREYRTDTSAVARPVHPFDVYDGQNVLLENSDCLHPQPMLHQGEGLHEHVIGTNQQCILSDEISPHLPSAIVILVVGVEDGQEGRGVNEDSHSPLP